MMPPEAGQGQASILVVDDTPQNLRLLTSILSEAGYRIRPVKSGQMAVETAFSEPPDLVLLDIRMPAMGGYQVAEALKAQPATSAIPIIFISALAEVEDKVKAFQAGGVDYINKPFHREEVLARVRTHLDLARLHRQTAQTNARLLIEIEERKKAEAARERLIAQLQKALAEVKTLSGLVPICAHCKKVRTDSGFWESIETYISANSDARLTHGMCPGCVRELYPEVAEKVLGQGDE